MTKDNSTGKPKDFYSRGQQMFDSLNLPDEDDDTQSYTSEVALTEAYRCGYEAAKAEQQQAKPVAWMVYTKDGQSVYVTDNPTDIQKAQRALPLYTTPPPCPTCEALARTVMLDQTSHDQFKPDWDAMAVMVEEQQRMAKRILELKALLERQTSLLERQTARIVDLQTHIDNFDGEE